MRRYALPWVILVAVSLVGAGGIAATAIQSLALRNAHREIATTIKSLNSEKILASNAEKVLISLEHKVKTLEAAVATTTTITSTTLPMVAPVLTDPQLLISTFNGVAEQLMGSHAPAGQAQAFVNQCQSAELHNAQLQSEGLPSVALDPKAEATAFINAHDAAAVFANGIGQSGQALNCMIDPGASGCTSNWVP